LIGTARERPSAEGRRGIIISRQRRRRRRRRRMVAVMLQEEAVQRGAELVGVGRKSPVALYDQHRRAHR
jgi:hypothetical protein